MLDDYAESIAVCTDKHSLTSPIAIIGLGSRFHRQSYSADRFWQLDEASSLPKDRWNSDLQFCPNFVSKPDITGSFRDGFVGGITTSNTIGDGHICTASFNWHVKSMQHQPSKLCHKGRSKDAKSNAT
ncbi:hypothetical protein [Pseudovibrio sp. Tun.PSC04-5.I4]|uniref:hypothetical protein n=1 Tax=Pseudovibrio sp. Tun.PSC04-5.I4 TaxID=1798213 RepID=UPI000890EA1E|nr:hypothetical protein [Pseudovibrio sp. Tun.PSC04-5.I4]SDQ13655.1 hypothetical protein SAMN04515695_0111 [Pseudovibrio sp. Tun.PSC04-5.I4]